MKRGRSYTYLDLYPYSKFVNATWVITWSLVGLSNLMKATPFEESKDHHEC